MNIQNTTEDDETSIRRLHGMAFGAQAGGTVADLAIALLHDETALPLLSLGAFDSRTMIGHVLFTSVRVSGGNVPVCACILAPLAVLPQKQRQGVGTELVKQGFALLRQFGCELVFVLGHPEYYPRFGFKPAGLLGLYAPYPIPEENYNAWMVLELTSGRTESVQGTVECARALNEPEHWRE